MAAIANPRIPDCSDRRSGELGDFFCQVICIEPIALSFGKIHKSLRILKRLLPKLTILLSKDFFMEPCGIGIGLGSHNSISLEMQMPQTKARYSIISEAPHFKQLGSPSTSLNSTYFDLARLL
jgi:hypothetical protein